MKNLFKSPLIRLFVVVAVLTLLFTLSISTSLAAELKLPSGLKRIEEQAFYGDTALDSVTIQEGTEVIESLAFARSSIKTVTLPASLYRIADNAFQGCENLKFNAQEGTYAYTWAVKNEYIKVNGGAAGEVTKVITSDTLRAGSDLTVQIIGPADTIHHSIYIVNEQTGEYQHQEVLNSKGNVVFSGYNFDTGNTYRLTVYTVTKQYQTLTPVVKIIQVAGQKPSTPIVDLPDTMKVNQSLLIRGDFDNETCTKTESYSTDGELIETAINYDYHGRIYIRSWAFYQHEDGGSNNVKYCVLDGDLWSEWSETKTISVTPNNYTVNVLNFPETIENGQDFALSFEYEGYADYCNYNIIPEGSEWAVTSGECQLGNESGTGVLQITTYQLDQGQYSFILYFNAEGAYKQVYQKTFGVVGNRVDPPEVNAEQELVYTDTYSEFYISTIDAEKIAIYQEFPEGYGTGYDTTEVYGTTTRWGTWFYEPGIHKLSFAVRREGKWSAWSEPIEVLVKEKTQLAAPNINADSPIEAGTDLGFTFDEIENATLYTANLQTSYSDTSLYSLVPATPSDLNEIPGYVLSSGSYTLEVNASADGCEPSSQKKLISVTGTRPDGPEFSVKEPLYSNQSVAVYNINTEDAQEAAVMYQYYHKGPGGDLWAGEKQYKRLAVNNNSTQWSYSISRYSVGEKLTVAFSVKKNNVWSAWKTKTYTIEEPPPLEPAVIHVDKTIEARTQFSIIVDPVENATYYDCYLYNASGWSVWQSDYVTSAIGSISLNSGDYEPGEYIFKVWAHANGLSSSLSEKTFTIKGLPPLEPAVIHVDDTIEARTRFSIIVDPVEYATYYECGLYNSFDRSVWWNSYNTHTSQPENKQQAAIILSSCHADHARDGSGF